LDERGLALVKQDPSQTAIDGVAWIHRDRAQAGAVIERRVPDVGDAVGDRDTGQAQAARDRKVPDAGDAVGDRITSAEAGRILDERGLALVEQDPSLTAIDGVAWIHRDRAQAVAASERRVPDVGDAGGDRDANQAAAARERLAPDAGDGGGDRVTSAEAGRILDERGLALVKQDPARLL